MGFCSECGAENDDNAVYCQDCGSKLNVKIMERVVEKHPENKPKNPHKKYYIIFGVIILLMGLVFFAWVGPGATPNIMLSNMIFGGGFVLFFLILILAIILKK